MTSQSSLDRKLKQIDEMKENKTITAAERTMLRSEALKNDVLNKHSSTTGSLITTEDSQTKAQRELLEQVRLMIGTESAPFLSATLAAALDKTTDEWLRKELTYLTTTNEFRRSCLAMFQQVEHGQVPPALSGTSETHNIARLAVRQFLIRLAVALLVSTTATQITNTNRVKLQGELLKALQDDSSRLFTAIMVQGAMSKINKVTDEGHSGEPPRKAARYESTRSRGEEQRRKERQQVRDTHMRCSNCGGRGHSSCSFPTEKAKFVCGLCHGKGHAFKDCPSPKA